MVKDPTGPFRTKIRLKDAGREPDRMPAAESPQAPPEQPGSLLEALKQARRPHTGARPQSARTADPAGLPSDRHDDGGAAESQPHLPKPPRPARAKVGRLAAARLRQLQRAKEAAASLESLARGEIEEAIVEIVHRDGKGRNHRRPTHPAQKR